MAYIGLQRQITRNNRKSIVLLLAFPLLVYLGVYAVMSTLYMSEEHMNWEAINRDFLNLVPIITLVVGIWFAIAFYANTAIINRTTGSKSLTRKENKRIYNLTENLCMSVGMPMPQLRIIHSPALNAFASGINEKTYTVTLTTGIIDALDDDELEGVIAHELMHIRNKDVRLLIISIVFVGIFSLIAQLAYRNFLYSGFRRKSDRDDKGGGAIIILVIMLVAFLAYLLSTVFKLALSRSREYLADSGAAQMTRKPWALASALRKISGNSNIESITNEDVKELFIDNSSENTKQNKSFMQSVNSWFSTHPPIEKRIAFLEQV